MTKREPRHLILISVILPLAKRLRDEHFAVPVHREDVFKDSNRWHERVRRGRVTLRKCGFSFRNPRPAALLIHLNCNCRITTLK